MTFPFTIQTNALGGYDICGLEDRSGLPDRLKLPIPVDPTLSTEMALITRQFLSYGGPDCCNNYDSLPSGALPYSGTIEMVDSLFTIGIKDCDPGVSQTLYVVEPIVSAAVTFAWEVERATIVIYTSAVESPVVTGGDITPTGSDILIAGDIVRLTMSLRNGAIMGVEHTIGSIDINNCSYNYSATAYGVNIAGINYAVDVDGCIQLSTIPQTGIFYFRLTTEYLDQNGDVQTLVTIKYTKEIINLGCCLAKLQYKNADAEAGAMLALYNTFLLLLEDGTCNYVCDIYNQLCEYVSLCGCNCNDSLISEDCGCS